MIQKRKMGFIIAIVPFLMATVSFAASENAGKNDPSVMTKEQDGSVSKNVFMEHHEWMFDQNDANKDGRLNTDEMRNLHKMVKKMHECFEHDQHK
ncbi:MAG: hypothetical protein ABTQ25_00820 [Nitrosomonas ureae]